MKVDYLFSDLQPTFHLSGKFPKKQEIKEDDLENQMIIQVGEKKKPSKMTLYFYHDKQI